MISKRDLNEAVAIGTAVVNALMISPGSAGIGLPGSQLIFDCGQLLATMASQMLPTAQGLQGTFWANLFTCFEDARSAGASYAAMDAVRTIASAPVGKLGIAVKNIAIRYSLVELAQILAATTFVSREDIDAALDKVNSAFVSAEETAANNFDNVSYQALIGLHAAVTQDLSNREQTLPRIITFSFARPMPALWLAQRIYADGSRGPELVAENKIQHPLFCPISIRALSQ